MHGSATVDWLLTALCAVTGTVCLLRARRSRKGPRRAAAGEALMGFGMAAMALPGSAAPPLPPVVFAVLFGGVGVWGLTLLREGRHARQAVAHVVHHLVGSLAMVSMALAMSGPSGGVPSGHMPPAGGLPMLTGVLLAYFAVYVLRTGVRLLPVTAAAGAGSGPHGAAAVPGGCAVQDLAPLATACRLAMGTGMFAMLLIP